MSMNNIRQLAEFKLASECIRDEPNLLLVVGHVNLLYSLLASEYEQTQRFEREFPTSNTASVRPSRKQPKQMYTMSEKLCSYSAPSSAAEM
jgi:phosphohistidine phosphatase SixA